jgi:thioredoxin-dependent peroxiredoxin
MVSTDPIDTNTKFAKEHDADFPILSDESKTVGPAYGVLGTTGRARRYTFYIGPDGKIAFIDKAVRANTAGEDLAAKLEELAAKGVVKRKGSD